MRPLTVLLGVAALSFCVFPEVAYSEPLRGTWSGSGTVEPAGGQREMVRCRVSYSPQGSKVVAVSATCTSASTTIRQTGQLSMVTPNRYVGDFYNSEYDISGRIRVSVSGSSQTVTFSSPRGKGSLSLRKQ
jgi:hypothetical protein